MNKYLLLILLIFIPVFVLSQTTESVYPIEQLGNCENEEACRAFCDRFENLESCINFTEENRITLSTCDIGNAKKLLTAFKSGVKLSFCESKNECRAYCLRPENLGQCVDFVESAGFLSHEEALLIKKTGGIGPGS